jgi:hypothetical protein
LDRRPRRTQGGLMQLAIDFAPRVRAARKLGAEAGERSRSKADATCPDFSDRAFAYIVSFSVASPAGATFTGEHLTDLMKMAGIRPHDDRAFGSIFAKALRGGVIRVVGYVPRVKGHGTSGGRLYAAGVVL